MTSGSWTIAEAVEEFARQGMPVDEYQFTKAAKAVLRRTGEGPSGERGGRGHGLYQIGQLQRLHALFVDARDQGEA